MIIVAVLVSLTLLGIAALHAWWGLGGVWPADDETTLVRTVVGDGRTRMPPPWQCYAVALLLVPVAVWPWLILALPTDYIVVAIGYVITGAFVLRGLAVASHRWRAQFPDQPFATWDRRVYGPLCFTIGVCFAVLLSQGDKT